MQIDALGCCMIMIYIIYLQNYIYCISTSYVCIYLWYLKRILCRLDLVVLGWLVEQCKLDPVTAVCW